MQFYSSNDLKINVKLSDVLMTPAIVVEYLLSIRYCCGDQN